jgi:hypothetical protein
MVLNFQIGSTCLPRKLEPAVKEKKRRDIPSRK